MRWIADAFRRTWFYVGALCVGVLYGLGGLVHIGHILGFGEMEWMESPVSWRVGDVWWGALDIVALVGIVMRSPVGIVALALAAGSQVAVYSLIPDSFALTDAHRAVLESLVYFNLVVIVALAIALFFAGRNDDA